ncbi:ANTH-domain-containing protein [Tuber magnatum]|uniref:ANTH-domain-containing protein n=1 Tax=Tuber magnatum TaxID=42249 RepID=A0A317T2J7_9PEZI|nr:ANTH-domain-containing protein [Tuber magnatum]
MAYTGSTRNVDMSRSESDLAINIKKATNIGKHVRSCIVYTWDHKSSQSFWTGMKVQPIMADEVQTFKALISIHKVLQEGHPVTIREAHAHTGWLESLTRGVAGEGLRAAPPPTIPIECIPQRTFSSNPQLYGNSPRTQIHSCQPSPAQTILPGTTTRQQSISDTKV